MMRLLSDEELEYVIGGDGNTATTLPQVDVHAPPSPSSWNVGDVYGSIVNVTSEVSGGGGGGSGFSSSPWLCGAVLCETIVSPAKIRCFATHYNPAGDEIPSFTGVFGVGGFPVPNADGSVFTVYQLRPNRNGAGGTTSDTGSSIDIFTGGSTKIDNYSYPLYVGAPTNETRVGPISLSKGQNLAWNVAHESYHANHPYDTDPYREGKANAAAQLAKTAYDQNPGACPMN